MSFCDVPKPKPRFKGIENFLRRIAFNLGNSPSQTEVKIISCIPIDVTDLQNKIVELERELDNLKPPCDTNRGAGGGGGGVGGPALTCAPALTTSIPGTAGFKCEPDTCGPCEFATSCNTKAFLEKYCLCESDGYEDTCAQNSLQKVKKMNRKKCKNRTEMVYYAQGSTRSPFTHYEPPTTASRRRPETEVASTAYLADLIQRQYQPERLDSSATSQFSSPVCRDEPDPDPTVDSDMCSCFHGHFFNLDEGREPAFLNTDARPHEAPPRRDYSMYYDSSLYDIVPVKERSNEIPIDGDDVFKESEDNYVEERDFSSNVRAHSRYKPFNAAPPPLRTGHRLLYRRKLPIKFIHRRDHVVNMMHKVKLDHPKFTDTSQSFSVECGEVYARPVHVKPRPPYCERPSPPPPAPVSPKPVHHKNAECLTVNLNDSECQTATNRSVQLEPPPLEENRTEITLNQIKSILHAVLTEVKTNSQMKYAVDKSPTKDAVVQKGQSESNIVNCSNFLTGQSFSPYSPLSQYGASFSEQPGGSALFQQQVGSAPAPLPPSPPKPFAPLKCVQNYPLFIQTTGRQCTCCYRNVPGGSSPTPQSQHASHALHTGHALHASHTHHAGQPTLYRDPHGFRNPHMFREGHGTHIATNTDRLETRHSKETEKLIKEIYKSLAVNVDMQKDTPSSEYVPIKSSSDILLKKLDKFQPVSGKAKTVESKSDDVQNKEGQEISKTACMSTNPEGETLTTSETSGTMQRRELTLTDESPSPSTGSERESRRLRQLHKPHSRHSSPSEDDSECGSSDIDSENTIVSEKRQKKEKKSLFSKMVMLFSKKSRRQRKKESSSEREQERASESDDYETVYIQRSAERIRRAPPRSPPAPRRAVHSKLSSARYHAPRRESTRSRRTPYIEQEYRRNWNENLTFHGSGTQSAHYSSLATRDSGSRGRRRRLHAHDAPPARARHPSYIRSRPSSVKKHSRQSEKRQSAPKGLAWLKKHKLCTCSGEQWKSLFLDN